MASANHGGGGGGGFFEYCFSPGVSRPSFAFVRPASPQAPAKKNVAATLASHPLPAGWVADIALAEVALDFSPRPGTQKSRSTA